jgi:hypothetical protein
MMSKMWSADRIFYLYNETRYLISEMRKKKKKETTKFDEQLLQPKSYKHIIHEYALLLTIQRTFHAEIWTDFPSHLTVNIALFDFIACTCRNRKVKCLLNVKHLTAQQVSGSAAVVGFSICLIRVALGVILNDNWKFLKINFKLSFPPQ